MEPTTIVLFGATGDLAKRKIYPALYNLYIDNKLPATFSLFGLGRREWTDESFRGNVEKAIREFSGHKTFDDAKINEFVKSFYFSVLNIDQLNDYELLLQRVEQREQELSSAKNRLFYLSVGPEFFATIAANIQESGLGATEGQGWKRLLIEKPFGHDLASARELNAKLSHFFEESEVYRIDHYLGKPLVHRFRTLLQTNPLLQSLWDNRSIANVQITAIETVGVEERASYYDHAGAIRDMFQNHLLQLLMMTAIRVPHGCQAAVVHEQKKQVMEALDTLQPSTVSQSVIRAQYGAGQIGGKPVVAYKDEPGVAEGSANDTFIAAKLHVADPNWEGVPFYIRTGKRMKEKATRIVIEFKGDSEQVGGDHPNLLVVEMSPGEHIRLYLNVEDEHNKGKLKQAALDLLPEQGRLPEAYENLIEDALHGDPSLFAHWEELELSWAWVQPVLEAFADNHAPLHTYEAGSYGPEVSHAMLAADGFHWWFDPRESASADVESSPLEVAVKP